MRGALVVGAIWLASIAGCASMRDVRADGLVSVEVFERSSGRTLERYLYRGKTWIAGNPGDRYAVRLINHSARRVLAVLSVDGVNAISGETASAQQSGYVLDPGASAEILGWRKSLDAIAQFYFTPLSDSYAARTNRPGNVGVIGVAVFGEREAQRPEPRVWGGSDVLRSVTPRREAHGQANDTATETEAAPSSAAAGSSAPQGQAALGERIGTGHGSRERSLTRYTEFRRASDTPVEVIRIFYDSHANLLARGVIQRFPRHERPDPFPQDVPGPFVPDPKG